MNNKYSNFLTILLVLIIIAIIGIIAFLGFKLYQDTTGQSDSDKFVDTFVEQLGDSSSDKNNTDEDENQNENVFEGVEEGTNSNNGSTSSAKNRPKYNGYYTVGTIEIPATKLKSPILDPSEYSDESLETAVVQLYGPGLNKVGNTTISGHNYRNNRFFANNKKLDIGDKIFITDLEGKKLSYTIYEKYETTPEDGDYMARDTQGAIEISLSSCTDDSKARIIILARADV